MFRVNVYCIYAIIAYIILNNEMEKPLFINESLMLDEMFSVSINENKKLF